MAGNGVGHLVADHRRQARIVPGQGQDARIDGHLAAGQAEGIDGLVVLHHLEFPLVVLARGGGNALAHPLQLGIEGRIVGNLFLFQDVLVGTQPHPHLLPFAEQQQLAASGQGHRLAGGKEEDGGGKKPGTQVHGAINPEESEYSTHRGRRG